MLFSLSVHSQNLVMNPSFEETDCDAMQDEFFYSGLHWYNVINSSPNYFSTSLEPDECPHSVPLGDQVPRTGTFMAGLWGSQTGSPTRDFIQSRLSEPLIADSLYCIEMYALRIESSPLAINRFGLQLSQDSLYDFSISGVLLGGVLLSSPVDEFLTDSENWMRLSWEYQAQGGEEYVTLGNFWEESELEYLDVDATDSFPLAFYHVDDVSITECSLTSLPQESFNAIISPNPVSNSLQVSLQSSSVDWAIYSMDGRMVKKGFLPQSGEIDVHDLSPALYILALTNDIGQYSTRVICKD